MNKVTDSVDSCILTWIVPVYNGEAYILQAIQSILNQPCKDLRIIIVDDGSTDLTATIVKGIKDSRVQYIYQKNSGVSIARNRGIQYSNSKYIAFLDADDVLCRDIYNNTLHELLESSQYDILSFSYFNADENLKRGNLQKVEKTGGFSCRELKIDCFKHVSSFIFLRKLFEDNSFLMFPEGIKCREDVSFLFLVLCYAERVLGIDKEAFVHRNNSVSVMHSFMSYDYLIDEAVPAWYWCKRYCFRSEDINECDARLFADVTDYIRYSCMQGLKIDEIQRKLEKPMIKETIRNYNVLWNSRKVVYEQFLHAPEVYWKKMRKNGLMKNVIKLVIHFPIVKRWSLKVQYKTDLSSYI